MFTDNNKNILNFNVITISDDFGSMRTKRLYQPHPSKTLLYFFIVSQSRWPPCLQIYLKTKAGIMYSTESDDSFFEIIIFQDENGDFVHKLKLMTIFLRTKMGDFGQ